MVSDQSTGCGSRSGKANRNKVFVIWKTPGYPDYHWLAKPDLDRRFGPGFTARLQRAILAWRQNDPDQNKVLELFGAQQFTTAHADDYKRIEEVGRQVGLIR